MGMEFAVLLLVFAGGGWWLDGQLGWQDRFPVLMVVGLLLGMVVGVFRLQRAVGSKYRKKAKDSHASRSDRTDVSEEPRKD